MGRILRWGLLQQLYQSLVNGLYRIRGGGGSGRPPPPSPPIIFEVERQILPQQTTYRWKGNLTASMIYFRYWKKYFDFSTL